MNLHTISQSQLDGDLYIMQIKKCPLTILYGQITKTSSILRYLPKNYSNFQKAMHSNSNEDIENSGIQNEEMKSGQEEKSLKR